MQPPAVPLFAGSADSADGRSFTFRHESGPPVAPGEIVVLDAASAGARLGQVLGAAAPASHEGAPGHGAVIGTLEPDGSINRTNRRPFSAASAAPASPDHLSSLQSGTLPLGTWQSAAADAPALLRAEGFNRHTFLCGQSGSGKTYSLGVILEQLLLATRLRVAVLDPNADFVGLGRAAAGAPEEAKQALQKLDIRVLGADDTGLEPLRCRFRTMPRKAQGAVLQLDPLTDRGEYNLLLHLLGTDSLDLAPLIAQLRSGDDDERSLAQRIENLGLHEWQVWAGEQPSASDHIARGPGLTVLDLGGFKDPNEPLAVSLDVIESLWSQRQERIPTLIVIDEAHNVCPARPVGPMQNALVDRLVQIAAEGRKYGLWLLLSTQRPSKIHPEVLSQCDNVMLMRINSAADVADLTAAFGYAPPAMVQATQSFVQGEALVAGAFAAVPAIIRMGKRLTVEGGSDVAVPVTPDRV